MNVRNAAAVVTGASRGLGRATAELLAERGAKVVMVARGEAELENAASEIRARTNNSSVHAVSLDVGSKDAIHRISGAAAALVGPVDILVHCASTLGPLPMPLLLDTACEDFSHVLEVNLLGPFRLTKAIAGAMALHEKGVVVFVSSDAGVDAYPHWGAYGVSKAAQDHLARTFAAELPVVRFYSVDPGEMDTKMHADAMPDADRAALGRPEDVARRLVDMIERTDAPNGARIALTRKEEAR